jgi:hypothetical protein
MQPGKAADQPVRDLSNVGRRALRGRHWSGVGAPAVRNKDRFEVAIRDEGVNVAGVGAVVPVA